MTAIKRTATDKHFSDAIRSAAKYVCQLCGIDYEHNKGGIDCSHVYSRKFKTTRWDTDNALCLCRSCHTKMADAPPDHVELAKRIKGDVPFWAMTRRKNSVRKITKQEEMEIRAHYRNEVKRIQEARNRGVMGYVEVRNWMEGLG